jgi:CRISPR/Cas system-associated exonuclease Cas4 (RecB family)
MHGRCQEQYRRRYIEGEKIPPGISMHTGSGFHKGAETNFTQKIETHEDLPAKEIVEAAVAGFDERVDCDGITLSEEEESVGLDKTVGQAKDRLTTLVALHAQQQAPEYQPTAVEMTVRIDLPGPRDLLGVIDLVDVRKRVTDFKTAAKRKSAGEVDTCIQLTTYAALYAQENGELPTEVRLDTVVATKTKIYRDLQISQRGKAHFDALAARINVVAASIETGIFPPATGDPRPWWCSDKFCGYYRTCPYVTP